MFIILSKISHKITLKLIRWKSDTFMFLDRAGTEVLQTSTAWCFFFFLLKISRFQACKWMKNIVYNEKSQIKKIITSSNWTMVAFAACISSLTICNSFVTSRSCFSQDSNWDATLWNYFWKRFCQSHRKQCQLISFCTCLYRSMASAFGLRMARSIVSYFIFKALNSNVCHCSEFSNWNRVSYYRYGNIHPIDWDCNEQGYSWRFIFTLAFLDSWYKALDRYFSTSISFSNVLLR